MHPLYLQEEISGLDAEPQEEYDEYSVTYRTLGNTIYGLEGFYRQNGDAWERTYYLSRRNGEQEGLERWAIELPPPEEYGVKEFFAAAFDVKSEEEVVLFLRGQQDELPRTVCYLAVHMKATSPGTGMRQRWQTPYKTGCSCI